MKKTKKQNFVARIFRGISNICRIMRLLCTKKHKQAKKIAKNGTIQTVETTYTFLFWLLEYLLPAIITSCIIVGCFFLFHVLGVGFSSENDANWFMGITSIILFIVLYEFVKYGVKYLVDTYISKE